ncbi:nucleotidyltransferase family protein [Anaeroselena agilis]|uniref:Nucleotidyltransferase family protein n=1 Tax=Anaeroselena agilis TaxID=3063788 RepID=A0ABU3NUP6_9FIRM|nr:nucleotidyltransferase family protein [Selenomonadales bacterium 4137-cl]
MIAAVVLAAGGSRRMGRPKQLLPLAGRPLVWHVAAAACRSVAGEVLVVTGAEQTAVKAAVACLPAKVIPNQSWREGQASSLKAGLNAVSPSARAVIFLLADQPLVTPELIDSLAAAWRAGGGSIVAPVAGGRRGNPVLFDLGRWLQPLTALAGDAGARTVIAANPDQLTAVPVVDEAMFFDVDTPDQYEEIKRLYKAIHPGGH